VNESGVVGGCGFVKWSLPSFSSSIEAALLFGGLVLLFVALIVLVVRCFRVFLVLHFLSKVVRYVCWKVAILGDELACNRLFWVLFC
jgi:hypothetical protein